MVHFNGRAFSLSLLGDTSVGASCSRFGCGKTEKKKLYRGWENDNVIDI